MSNDLLDHAERLFPPPERAFDRLARRRDRKRRNQRIGAAVLALVIAVAAIGGAIHAFRNAVRQRPATGGVITPGNVGSLHVIGSGRVGGHPISVKVSGGLVYVVSRGSSHTLTAFSATCTSDCHPVWVADARVNPVGWAQTAEGMVYVAADDLYAFSSSCGSGGSTCQPTWVGRLPGPTPAGPVVSGDAVYAVSDGRLYSFPTSCAQEGGECHFSWVSVLPPIPLSWLSNRPVVIDDMVYLFSDPGTYVAFPTDCGSNGSTCRPLEGAPTPPPPIFYPKVVAEGKVFVGTDLLRAFPAGCADHPHLGQPGNTACEPLWTSSAANSSRLGLFAPGNGVLFVMQRHGGCCGNYPGPRGGILAFPSDCGTGDATCDPVWTWGTAQNSGPHVSITSLAEASDRLYAAAGNGDLYVFALGSAAAERSSAPAPNASNTGTIAFYVGLLAVAAILLLMRARRRRSQLAPRR